jgi:ABC-2 type transport system permease protein
MLSRLKGFFAVPGSVPWLFKKELLLMWRGLGGKSLTFSIIMFAILWLAMHGLAVALVYGLSAATKGGMQLPAMTYTFVGAGFWIFFSISLSQTLATAVNVFFTRGDLDLLLSSPISPRTVLAVRALGIGFGAILLPILLILPFAHAGLVLGKPSLMTIYPALVAFALLGAAVGVWMTLSLVTFIGARRAKVFAQVLGALIGAFFFLLSQMHNLLGRERRDALGAWLKQHAADGGIFAPDSVLWWPGRAFLGELLPTLAFIVIAVALYWFVVQMTYKRFVEGAQESATVKQKNIVRDSDNPVKFADRLMWIMLKKEWRMIGRDPQVISQTLLQLLYLVPMLFMAFSGKFSLAFALPAVVVMVAMLTGNLAWLTIAAEDAPELIVASPISVMRIRIIKGAAAVIPSLLVIAPLVCYWLVKQPLHAIALAIAATGGAMSAAASQILNPQKGDRREMNKRGKVNIIGSLLDFLSSAGWALFGWGLIGAWWACLIALPFMAAGPGYAFVAGESKRRAGEWA